MYRNRNPLLVTWCVAVVAWCSSAGAQVPASGLITLEFQGGTVAEYVVALRNAGDDPSIVVMPEAADIPVPALQLNSVALQSALQLIAGEATLPGGRVMRSQLVGFESDEGATVWRISAALKVRERLETPEVSIWSVSDLLSGTKTVEAILSAVETAVELIADPKHAAQIRFHEDTALLIVHGRKAQLRAVEDVLQQLQMAEHNRARARQRDAQNPVADLFDWIQEMKKLDDTQAGLGQALEEAGEKIAELTKLIEQQDQEIAELKQGRRVKRGRGGEGRGGESRSGREGRGGEGGSGRGAR